MNYRIIFHMAGRVLLAEAGLLVLPLAVSLLYREDCAWAVLASMAVAAVLGGLLTLLDVYKRQTLACIQATQRDPNAPWYGVEFEKALHLLPGLLER